jgi:hypothetical protein
MTSLPNDLDEDVPSPIDLRDPTDANEWVAASDRTRPWRVEVRTAIAELVSGIDPAPRRVLELGAGPGLLAAAILQTACHNRRHAVRGSSANGGKNRLR